MKNNGASERHQMSTLKALIAFAYHLNNTHQVRITFRMGTEAVELLVKVLWTQMSRDVHDSPCTATNTSAVNLQYSTFLCLNGSMHTMYGNNTKFLLIAAGIIMASLLVALNGSLTK
jgi:hypothetical protein